MSVLLLVSCYLTVFPNERVTVDDTFQVKLLYPDDVSKLTLLIHLLIYFRFAYSDSMDNVVTLTRSAELQSANDVARKSSPESY